MGCLLAEFKLTAMLYEGRREGTTAFWVAALCTPPLAFSVFVSRSALLPLSRSLNLTGEIWNASWIQVCCEVVSSLRDLGRFHGKICQTKTFFLFFLGGKNIRRKLIHKKTPARSRSAVAVQKLLCLMDQYTRLIRLSRHCSKRSKKHSVCKYIYNDYHIYF